MPRLSLTYFFICYSWFFFPDAKLIYTTNLVPSALLIEILLQKRKRFGGKIEKKVLRELK